MKKFVLVLGLILSLCANAWADICYDVNDKVANSAVNLIKAQKEIYDYCSICPDANPQIIPVDNVQNSNPVYVHGIALDLAHTYYKDGNKFVNLGVASECIKAGEYNITAELDSLPNIHRTKENDKEQAKIHAQDIFEKCVSEAELKDNATTADMIQQNIKINDCLESAIKQEIEKGFVTDEQAKILEYVGQIRRATLGFYFGVYAENKYCHGGCGSISNILPYTDEYTILMNMLEKLIYLNIAKNGY